MANSSSYSTFFCTVCMENRPYSEAVPANKRCITHPPFCKRCTINYLTAAICTSKRASVKCMSVDCRSRFDALRCFRDLKLVSRDLFGQWCDLLCESSVLGYERCYCPNLACNELIIDECVKEFTIGRHTSAARRRIECPNCKIEFCFRCFSAWNDNHRCSVNEDDAIIVVEREKWVQCPGCKNYVQHNQGCHQITCRCGTVFCYLCGKRGKRAQQFHFCGRGRPLYLMLLLFVPVTAAIIVFLIACLEGYRWSRTEP